MEKTEVYMKDILDARNEINEIDKQMEIGRAHV